MEYAQKVIQLLRGRPTSVHAVPRASSGPNGARRPACVQLQAVTAQTRPVAWTQQTGPSESGWCWWKLGRVMLVTNLKTDTRVPASLYLSHLL